MSNRAKKVGARMYYDWLNNVRPGQDKAIALASLTPGSGNPAANRSLERSLAAANITPGSGAYMQAKQAQAAQLAQQADQNRLTQAQVLGQALDARQRGSIAANTPMLNIRQGEYDAAQAKKAAGQMAWGKLIGTAADVGLTLAGIPTFGAGSKIGSIFDPKPASPGGNSAAAQPSAWDTAKSTWQNFLVNRREKKNPQWTDGDWSTWNNMSGGGAGGNSTSNLGARLWNLTGY